jgi:hypothetical protein
MSRPVTMSWPQAARPRGQGARVRTASSASAVAATAKRQKVIVSGPVWETPMGPAM